MRVTAAHTAHTAGAAVAAVRGETTRLAAGLDTTADLGCEAATLAGAARPHGAPTKRARTAAAGQRWCKGMAHVRSVLAHKVVVEPKERVGGAHKRAVERVAARIVLEAGLGVRVKGQRPRHLDGDGREGTFEGGRHVDV